MILSFKRDMTHNYMVTESEEILSPNDYQIHMLAENRISGLLPCCVKKVNGRGKYFYDITSRQAMAYIYEKEHIGADDIRILLRGLYAALKETKKYLLDADRVVLEPEMIYMDIETKEPLFCYLPVYEGTIHDSFGKLTEYIMRRLDQSDSRAVLLGYEIYRQSMEENYSLEKLLKKAAFESYDAQGEAAGRAYAGQERAVGRAHAGQERAAGRAHAGQEGTADNGYEVQEEPTDRRQNDSSTEQRQNSARERRSQKPGKKNGMDRKRSQRKEKGSGAARAAVLITLLLILTAAVCAAAWMWELDMTQLGGIVFLLVCLIGYGFSAETKHRKKAEDKLRKQEERADQRSVKKMQDMEKTMRKGEENAPLRKREETQWQESKIKQKKGGAPRESEEPDDGAGRQMIGATVLLNKGEGEYEPHLSLISMNPRDRNSIVLLNDSYTVGKLKNKSDIYIDDPSISRIHARIKREGKEYWLCDLNSTNGTFVNGRRLAVNESVPIKLSDEIRFAELGYYVGRC